MNFSKKNHSLPAFGVKLQKSNKSFASKKLITTIVLLVFAFTMIDAQIKKSTKTKIPANKGFQQIEVKQKIDKNAILESDLFADYNKTQLVKVSKEKKVLLSNIKKGSKSAEAKMGLLAMKEKSIKSNLNIAESYSKRIKLVGKINPIGPCPPRDNGKCLIDVLKRLLVSDKIKMNIKVLDTHKKTIGYLEKKPSYTDTKLGLNGYKFILTQKYSGNVYLDIIRTELGGSNKRFMMQAILK